MILDNISLNIVKDSRGNDTLETSLKSGVYLSLASVPSGKSTGATEAAVVEPNKALEKVSWLNSQLTNREFESLENFDNFLLGLDGTENKSSLGGNLMLAFSLAFTRLLAKQRNTELFKLISDISGNDLKLPLCFYNLIEGGVHAENSLPFQEYLFIPQTDSPKKNLDLATVAINKLKEKVQEEYGKVVYGDEGGFSVPSSDPLKGLKLLEDADGKIGLDTAASALMHDGSYRVGNDLMSRHQLLELYKKITSQFRILSIEDPFDEEDWEGFSALTAKVGNHTWIIGDDLLTTNVERIKKAHKLQAVNAVLIKPNQIGTVSETIRAANLAKSYGWKIIVSHRSGETMDTFIADLAVGLGADGLKSGCPLQKERLVKYERLIEIEGKI